MLDINWKCLSVDRWHNVCGLMLKSAFEERSVLSVSIIETKMCLDVVFGSCCSPGMTVDAHIKHEVNSLFFSFFAEARRWLFFFLPHLDAVTFNAPSPHSVTVMKNMDAAGYFNRLSAWKSKLCLAVMASIAVPESSVRYAGRVTTIFSHPYLSPSFGVLVSLACSAKKKKHIFSSALFSFTGYFFFSRMCVCDELGLSVVRVGVQAV